MVSSYQRARNCFVPVYVFPRQCTLKLITLTLRRPRHACGAQQALPFGEMSCQARTVQLQPMWAVAVCWIRLKGFGEQNQANSKAQKTEQGCEQSTVSFSISEERPWSPSLRDLSQGAFDSR